MWISKYQCAIHERYSENVRMYIWSFVIGYIVIVLFRHEGQLNDMND